MCPKCGVPTQNYGAQSRRTGKTNGMAITSFICSLTVPFVGGLLAIIFGHIGLSQINSRGDTGKGFAIVGLIFGYLQIVALIVLIAIAAAHGRL
jgi:hypothetical protein